MLRGFVGALKLTVADVSIGLDIEPEKGAADSGDLEIDLPNLFVAVAEAAAERKAPWPCSLMKSNTSATRNLVR